MSARPAAGRPQKQEGKAAPLARIGVINVSDRASAGVYEDTPGKACVALLMEWLATPFDVDYRVVPDERAQIEANVRRKLPPPMTVAVQVVEALASVEAAIAYWEVQLSAWKKAHDKEEFPLNREAQDELGELRDLERRLRAPSSRPAATRRSYQRFRS